MLRAREEVRRLRETLEHTPEHIRQSHARVTYKDAPGDRGTEIHVFELLSVALTDPTQKGDFHGDVDAVRRANTEDPHHKVYERAPAVARARAMVA